MARKSRKHPNIDLIIKPSRDTVGYIRLSVRNKDSFSSIENQNSPLKTGDANIRPLSFTTISTMVSAVIVLIAQHSSKRSRIFLPVKLNVSLSKTFPDSVVTISQLAIIWKFSSLSYVSGLCLSMTNSTQLMVSPIRIKKFLSNQEFVFHSLTYLMNRYPLKPKSK